MKNTYNELKVKRSYAIPENEMVIIKDTNTLLHNIVDSELKEKDKEIERLNENNQAMQEEMARTWKKLDEKENIIKDVREYVDKWKNIARYKLLEMLDKDSDKECQKD